MDKIAVILMGCALTAWGYAMGRQDRTKLATMIVEWVDNLGTDAHTYSCSYRNIDVYECDCGLQAIYQEATK